MGKFYTVVRIIYKGQTESHSVEHKATLKEAQKRLYSIIAADFADESVTWCAAYLINSDGVMMEGKVFDKSESEE